MFVLQRLRRHLYSTTKEDRQVKLLVEGRYRYCTLLFCIVSAEFLSFPKGSRCMCVTFVNKIKDTGVSWCVKIHAVFNNRFTPGIGPCCKKWYNSFPVTTVVGQFSQAFRRCRAQRFGAKSVVHFAPRSCAEVHKSWGRREQRNRFNHWT